MAITNDPLMLPLNTKGMKMETSSKESLGDPPKRVYTRKPSYTGRRLDKARISERLNNLPISEVLIEVESLSFIAKYLRKNHNMKGPVFRSDKLFLDYSVITRDCQQSIQLGEDTLIVLQSQNSDIDISSWKFIGFAVCKMDIN